MNPYPIIVSTLLSLLVVSGAMAGSNELKQAQQALAAGDYQAAYPQYLAFAEQNNYLAQFTVAMFHQLGWGTLPIDSIKACSWHQKAAQGGIPASAHALGECYEQGVLGTPDPESAARWYQEAADLGHHSSLCSLADLYMAGRGVVRDPHKAVKLCTESAQQSAVNSQFKLGRYLLLGDQAIRDYPLARHWLETAAPRSREAQYYLGVLHRDGLGSEADAMTALQWFEQAAMQGYAPAYFETAKLYVNASTDLNSDPLTPEALAKAYMWLRVTALNSKLAEEVEVSRNRLQEVLAVMPDTWVETLDARVSEFLVKQSAPLQ